jgi:hypothetical protein
MTASSRSLLPPGYEALAPPGGPPGPPRRGRSPFRVALAAAASFVILVVALTLYSMVAAAMKPGNESFSAKWADWLRANGAAGIVNQAEAFYYSSHQPAKGGRPKELNAVAKAQPTRIASPAVTVPPGLPAPTPVPLVVQPALPGEGVWQPVGPVVDGRPGMYEAQFRADTVFTSEITTAVWIDPKIMQLSLIPGLTEPGGSWTHPPYITPTELPFVAAAFNGGFRFQDAHGGFYLDGRTAIPLVPGAASLVFYRDGHVDVGAWGTEVSMTPDVVSVLQNLVPMVDHGAVSPLATYDDHAVWGNTLNTSIVVARSGVGVTADGALVYVAGPALTARTLAEALQRAGAVRAMTLDINPEWVTFNLFSHPSLAQPSEVTGMKLYPGMQRPADRYLPPTLESRDFIEVSVPH